MDGTAKSATRNAHRNDKLNWIPRGFITQRLKIEAVAAPDKRRSCCEEVLAVQHAFAAEQGNSSEIGRNNRVGHEDEFLIKNLRVAVIAYPILIVEVKQIWVDGLDGNSGMWLYFRKDVP